MVAGEYRLDTVSGQEQELMAAKVIIHEDYNSALVRNDISLLRLEGSFTLNQVNARAVVLATSGLGGTEAASTTIVAGWGATQV